MYQYALLCINSMYCYVSLCISTVVLQIEFYFGDANLPKDKFLQGKIKESSDGCM